jgi:hypothetical protein
MRQKFQTMTGWLLSAGVLSLLALTSGCSAPGSISGKVTYQNEPVTEGTVVFSSTQGKGSRTATLGEDGSYSIDNIPAGQYKIAVVTPTNQPERNPRGKGPPPNMMPPKDKIPAGASSPVYSGQPKKAKKPQKPIPDDFADPDKSGLTYTVKSGPQTHPIDMK